MAIITLFDKSFLQCLSADESVWFDHFFCPNVCPIFFVETLADLEKAVREGRTPEQEVGIIADKFPEIHGTPNIIHNQLVTGELLGFPVDMSGKIILNGRDQEVSPGGMKGRTHYKLSSEADAFSRWKHREFLEIEREIARRWRDSITGVNLEEVARQMRASGVDNTVCRTLADAKELATRTANRSDHPVEMLRLIFLLFDVPRQAQSEIYMRWEQRGFPPLSRHAPYVCYALTAELFFRFALAARLIAGTRASHRVDMMYLLYLPFCEVFASGDKLHRLCAPYFMREDQSFAWGFDLKEGLGGINAHYASLPAEVRERGIFAFAGSIPPIDTPYVGSLWDRHRPNWKKHGDQSIPLTPELQAKLGELLLKQSDDPRSLSLERRVTPRRGSWAITPPDLPKPKDA